MSKLILNASSLVKTVMLGMSEYSAIAKTFDYSLNIEKTEEDYKAECKGLALSMVKSRGVDGTDPIILGKVKGFAGLQCLSGYTRNYTLSHLPTFKADEIEGFSLDLFKPIIQEGKDTTYTPDMTGWQVAVSYMANDLTLEQARLLIHRRNEVRRISFEGIFAGVSALVKSNPLIKRSELASHYSSWGKVQEHYRASVMAIKYPEVAEYWKTNKDRKAINDLYSKFVKGQTPTIKAQEDTTKAKTKQEIAALKNMLKSEYVPLIEYILGERKSIPVNFLPVNDKSDDKANKANKANKAK
jgi:hypothetical protein